MNCIVKFIFLLQEPVDRATLRIQKHMHSINTTKRVCS